MRTVMILMLAAMLSGAPFELSTISSYGNASVEKDAVLGTVLTFTGKEEVPAGTIQYSDSVTVEAFVKIRPSEKAGDSWTIIGSYGSMTAVIYSYPSGGAKFIFQAWSGGKAFTVKTTEILVQDRWYYLCAVYDAQKRTADMFVNGVELTAAQFQERGKLPGAIDAPTRPFVIGNQFRGNIALLSVSAGVKDKSSIQAVYDTYASVLGKQSDISRPAKMPTDVPKPVRIMSDSGRIEAVPTFHSCGLYVPAQNGGECLVRYRDSGGEWQRGMNLWLSTNDGMFRGSILSLAEGTSYEAEVKLTPRGGAAEILPIKFRTWSSAVPIAKTIRVKDVMRDGRLHVTDKGSADGWIRYDGTDAVLSGTVRDPEACVLVDGAQYVILENFTVRGGYRHAIEVRASKDVRIIRGDMARWGRTGIRDWKSGGKYFDSEGKIINNDAGVFINRSQNTVIERCYMHDPNGTSNPWEFDHPAGWSATHPAGPNAVYVRSLGGTVIRWNDFIGSDQHRWNDSIEGEDNGASDGGLFRDADIYGNMLAFGQDDSIEMDGGQMNVRFFQNKVEGFLCGVSIAPCVLGPSYVYRNLIVNLGDVNDLMNTGIKPGGGDVYHKGRAFVLNNTIVTPGKCIGGAGYGGYKDSAGYRVTSRNNILVSRNSQPVIYDALKWDDNDFDYDVMYGARSVSRDGIEPNGKMMLPKFIDVSGGDLRLAEAMSGTPLAGITGERAVMGAYQNPGDCIPMRPIPVRADRYQITFSADKGDASVPAQTIRISVNDASYRKKFRVEKNDAFSWFTVSPAEGTVSDGMQFTVMPDIRSTNAGKGLFLLRTDDGFSLPVSVYVSLADKRNEIDIEAESASAIPPPFTVVDDATASGRALFVDPKDGQFSAQTNACVEYDFALTESGSYLMLFRVRSLEPVGQHDSFFLSVDGGARVQVNLNSASEWVWHTHKRTELSAGKHTLAIYPRETGVYIDRIYIGKNKRTDQ